jgi:hypothetical protein
MACGTRRSHGSSKAVVASVAAGYSDGAVELD